MNVKILVCCHKKDIFEKGNPYFPIHVGKQRNLDLDLGIVCDNTGDNISLKNNSYCELTGMYWAWKNLKNTDVIGLCHYRRYFDFHNQCRRFYPYTDFPTREFNNIDLSIPNDILKKVYRGNIIIASPKLYPYSLELDYCRDHISDDFRVLREVIRESQPEKIQKAFDNVVVYGNKLSHFNMFLMNWDDFDSYCSWLFPLLEEVENRIDISHYNAVQQRIYGYIGERLLQVWIVANKRKFSTKKVIWFLDDLSFRMPLLKQIYHNMLYRLSFSILNWNK